MERFTEKLDEKHVPTLHTLDEVRKGMYRPANFHTSIECYNKLGSLEDIEEKFGIDLNKLLSAKEVYYMDWANYKDDSLEIAKTFKIYLNLTNNRIEFLQNEYSDTLLDLEPQNYGKKDIWGGWAFTKEELCENMTKR